MTLTYRKIIPLDLQAGLAGWGGGGLRLSFTRDTEVEKVVDYHGSTASGLIIRAA